MQGSLNNYSIIPKEELSELISNSLKYYGNTTLIDEFNNKRIWGNGIRGYTNYNNDKTFWQDLCDNNYGVSQLSDPSLNFGYSNSKIPYYIVPIISLILNFFAIYTTIKKAYSKSPRNNSVDLTRDNLQKLRSEDTISRASFIENNAEEKPKGLSSLEKMLFALTFLESIVALAWLFSNILFNSAEDMHKKCYQCFTISVITTVFQTFDWCFFACVLHNLKTILDSPIEEGNLNKRLKYYIIISIAISAGFTFMVIQTNIYGISPMLTCFIKNSFADEPGKIVGLYLTLSLPFLYVFWCIYTFISIFKKRKINRDRQVKISTIKLLIYSLLYIIFYFPTFILYIFTVNQNIHKNTFLSWLSYYCSLSNMSVNLVLSVGRILDGYVSCSWSIFFTKAENEEYNQQQKDHHRLSSISEVEEDNCDDKKEELDVRRNISKKRVTTIMDVGANILGGFIRELFIGISLTLLKNKQEVPDVPNKYMNKFSSESIKHQFNSSKRSHEVDYFKELRIDQELETNPVDIVVTEHAPKIFKRIRKIEKLDEEEIVRALIATSASSLSSNDGGRSGALFLPTNNKKFLIKTLEKQDFDTILNNSFLTYYLIHLENNQNSLLCRFYGIFSVASDNSGTPLRLIIMRNATGSYKKLIRGTYDLKGSTLDRYVEIKNSEEYFKVRKDINFDKDIGGLDLKKEDKERFIANTENDSIFLEDQGIMDYSLFIFKLEYTDEELEKIKSSENFKFYSKYFYESNLNSTKRKDHKSSGQRIDSMDEFTVKRSDSVKSEEKSDEYASNEFNDENKRSVYSINDVEYRVGFVIMIIDYLQIYNRSKYWETTYKTYIRGAEGEQSSVKPDEYSARFIKYCKAISTYRRKSMLSS